MATGGGLVPPFPDSPTERNRWVLEARPDRNRLDPTVPYAFLSEREPDGRGGLATVSTLFLTNRECPFRCTMCDLWRNTLIDSVRPGDIPAQIDLAMGHLPTARWLKLYNSGSFFDPRAILPEDYPEIALRCRNFERVIVECHPSFLGERARRFRDQLDRPLQVAIGLETADPLVLSRLNKGMDLDSFRRAADWLRSQGMELRVFVLVRPPWQTEAAGVEWACRSLDLAFDSGAVTVSVIPTRAGNGAMERLANLGEFTPPLLRSLVTVFRYGLALRRGTVLVDLWDLESLPGCAACRQGWVESLAQANLTQRAPDPVPCANCGGSG